MPELKLFDPIAEQAEKAFRRATALIEAEFAELTAEEALRFQECLLRWLNAVEGDHAAD